VTPSNPSNNLAPVQEDRQGALLDHGNLLGLAIMAHARHRARQARLARIRGDQVTVGTLAGGHGLSHCNALRAGLRFRHSD